MHLIYLDESGNTGVDLNDSHQPVFVLGALLVPEECWLRLETDLTALVERFFPSPRPDDFELHATELMNPRGELHRLQGMTMAELGDLWAKKRGNPFGSPHRFREKLPLTIRETRNNASEFLDISISYE